MAPSPAEYSVAGGGRVAHALWRGSARLRVRPWMGVVDVVLLVGLGTRRTGTAGQPLPLPTASTASAAYIVPAALAVSTAREGGKRSSLGR
jgi:hypothetical protein